MHMKVTPQISPGFFPTFRTSDIVGNMLEIVGKMSDFVKKVGKFRKELSKVELFSIQNLSKKTD